MSDKKEFKESLSQEERQSLLSLVENLEEVIPIIKKIDSQTLHQLNILSVHSKKLETIETIATQATIEIAKNTQAMATHLKETVDTNKELINIIAGKKQVPLNIFVIVLIILACIEFVILSQVFSMGIEIDTGIVKGKITPNLVD